MFLEIAERSMPNGAHEEKNSNCLSLKGKFFVSYLIQVKGKGFISVIFPCLFLERRSEIFKMYKSIYPLKRDIFESLFSVIS